MTVPPPTRPPPTRPPPNRLRRSRVIAVLGFVLAWLAVMVIGAGTGDPDSSIGIPELGDVVTAVFIVLLFLGFVILVLSVLNQDGKRPTPTRKRSWVARLVMVILIALALNQIANQSNEPRSPAEVQVSLPPTTVPAVTGERHEDASRQQLTLLAVAAVAALGAAVVLQQRRRPTPVASPETEPPEEDRSVVARGLAMTARQLRSEADPRRAVLLAYAGLEAGLDDQGRGRVLQETPYEYVGRILRSVDADPEPVQELARLYHDARFSERVITSAEQEQAALAFERAHDQLVSHPTGETR